MRRIRTAASSARELVARLVRPFTPEPGTTEGVVTLGLLLIAIGFAVWPGMLPGAFLIPGALFVLIGMIPLLRKP